MKWLGALSAVVCGCSVAAFPGAAAPARAGGPVPRPAFAAVGYTALPALVAAVRAEHGTTVRLLPSLRLAEVRLPGVRGIARLRGRPGIRFARGTVHRRPETAPVSAQVEAAAATEWQVGATHEDAVPENVLQAARRIRIAIIDTGADLGAPGLALKHPATYDVLSRTRRISDLNGHGTFVASVAGAALGASHGLVGSGGDAQLLIVRAGGADGRFTDVDEAAAIVYAVDHGARILNLSLGGVSTSPTERLAIRYAVRHGVLLVAPVGNDYGAGDPAEFPAALLQPVGSFGRGGVGLAVAASTSAGGRAPFSNTGSYVSLAAPGEGILGELSRFSSPALYPRTSIPGLTGLYGYASGTSFAAPQVAGAAALVWAADPALTAKQVARILKQTASGNGAWTPELGFGVVDVAAAIAAAQAAASAATPAAATTS